MTFTDFEDYATVLIIGNGFDKQCGLKSSYNDFFKDQAKTNEKFKQYDDQIKEIKPKYESSQIVINNSYINGFPRFDKTFTAWDAMFILLNYLGGFSETPRWCDVEEMMKKTLGTQTLTRSFFSWATVLSGINELITLSENAWDTITNNSYIPLNGTTHPSYNSLELIMARQILKSKGIQKARSITYDELQDYLANQRSQFERRFGDYIKSISEENAEYKKRAHDVSESLFKNGDSSNNKKRKVCSFNYTNPPIQCDNFVHIHGNCNGTVVFGIDDVDPKLQISEKFFKTKRKADLKIDSKGEAIEFKETGPGKLIFYGHSFTIMDKDSLFQVFDAYQIARNPFIAPAVEKRRVLKSFGPGAYDSETEIKEIPTPVEINQQKPIISIFYTYNDPDGNEAAEKDQFKSDVKRLFNSYYEWTHLKSLPYSKDFFEDCIVNEVIYMRFMEKNEI